MKSPLTLILLTTLSFPVLAQQSTLTCSSQGNRRQLCEVQTQNQVTLVRRLSTAPCVEGESWGFNRRGVWVKDGCSAEFRVGREAQADRENRGDRNRDRDRNDSNNNQNNNRSNRDRDTAIAIGAGIALLGAIAALNNTPTPQPAVPPTQPPAIHGRPPQPPAIQGRPPQPPQPPHLAGTQRPSPNRRIPSWVVGEFAGFNPTQRAHVYLEVRRNGLVFAEVNGFPYEGFYDDGQFIFDGARFFVARDGEGLRIAPMEGRGESIRYRRIN